MKRNCDDSLTTVIKNLKDASLIELLQDLLYRHFLIISGDQISRIIQPNLNAFVNSTEVGPDLLLSDGRCCTM
jgi:hypothetical protein